MLHPCAPNHQARPAVTDPPPAAVAPTRSRARTLQPNNILRVAGPAAALVVVQLVLFPMPAGAWLQGVILGLLNAIVVLGLMLIYRANRVLNLAQASMGAYPATLAAGVAIIGGMAFLPASLMGAQAAVVGVIAIRATRRSSWAEALIGGVAIGIGATVGLLVFSHGGYLGALVVGLTTAVLLGVGVDVVVVRRFQRAPRLILTVATIGLAQLFSVGALLMPRLWHKDVMVGNNNRATYTVPFTLKFTIGQQVFRADDLVAAVLALACLVVVTALLRRSDIGTAVRAAADRSDRAALLGIPVLRLETLVWVVAAVLSFLGVFLQGAVLGVPLNAAVGLTTLVTALAAMALGRFENLPTALVAAVAVGVLNKGVAWNNGQRPEMVYAVLAAVIVVGLLILRSGRRRVGAGEVSSWQASTEPRSVPSELRNLTEVRLVRRIGGAVALAVAAALPLWLDQSQEFRASTIAALAILGLSVVVLTGWAGEVTLGQMAFAAVGGAVGALATMEWHWDLSLTLLVAGACGALAAVIVGIPSLRFHGLFLAVTTLAFALATNGFLLKPSEATWIPQGALERRPLLGVWGLDGQGAMYEVCLAVLVLALIAMAGVRRTRSGRVLRAVRDNQRAAQAFGVRAPLARLTAFGLSGFLAAVAGCLLVYVNQGYDAGTFSPEQGLNVFISAVVGGVGSAVGGVLGAVVLDGSRTFLNEPWSLLPTAAGVLGVLIVIPGGLAELAYRARDWGLRRLAARRGIEVPSLVADRGPDTLGGREGLPTVVEGAEEAGPVVPAPTERGWLSARGVDVAYDRVQVLFGVDMDIREGEITALLGTNGAGKSTLLRAIGGVTPVTSGSIFLGDTDLCRLRPEQVAALGIAQMPGGQGVFPSLTVEENLRAAAWLLRKQPDLALTRMHDVYGRFPVLDGRRTHLAGDLSGGQQQQLALGMALLVEPKLLLVDELSLGLAPTIVEQLLEEMRQLRDAGTTIVVVEQSVNVALTIADHAFFMEKGEVRFSGPAQELLDEPDLVRSVYLHGASEGLRRHDKTTAAPAAPAAAFQPAPDGPAAASSPVSALAVRGLAVSFGGIAAVRDVDLSVAPGEIVGLIGPNGAGKTTVFDLISGFTAADAGRVSLRGHELSGLAPSARARAGLGRSFQDARLFGGLTVAETLAVSLERWIDAGDPINGLLRSPASQATEAAVTARVEELIDVFGLGAFRDKLLRELSTGSRRIVDLACVVAHGPTVVLLDEPSSGIAQREAEALAPLMRQLRDQLGASLLVVEHDMSLISAVADRLVALDQGAVVTEGTPHEVLEHPDVVAAYLGGSDKILRRTDVAPTAKEPIPND